MSNNNNNNTFDVLPRHLLDSELIIIMYSFMYLCIPTPIEMYVLLVIIAINNKNNNVHEDPSITGFWAEQQH